MDILDDIEIVDVPKRAQEIREMKLNALKERLKEIDERINATPSDEDDIIKFFNWWSRGMVAEKIRLIENANVS